MNPSCFYKMKKNKTSFGVSYYGTHFPWHFEQDIKEMKKSGINHIVYAASEYELGFYLDSTIEFAKIAKKHGILFIINFWAHGNAFGGEGGSFFVNEHPETWQVTSQNKKIAVACFNHPIFLEFMLKQLKKITKHSDGIFFDEPAFFSNKKTGEVGCFCDMCKQKFEQQFKKPMLKASDKELANFRNNSLVLFMDTLAKKYKKENAKGITMICLYPFERDETLSWTDFLNLESIDVFGSDPYWKDPYWIEFINKTPDYVKEVGLKIVQQTKEHEKQSQIWIQSFKIENEQEIYEAVNYAKECNPDFITAWTYKGACYSELANKNWKKSWNLLLKAYNTKK